MIRKFVGGWVGGWVCVSVCVFVCVRVCMCVSRRQTDRQTDRQPDRQTETETDRDREPATERQRNRDRDRVSLGACRHVFVQQKQHTFHVKRRIKKETKHTNFKWSGTIWISYNTCNNTIQWSHWLWVLYPFSSPAVYTAHHDHYIDRREKKWLIQKLKAFFFKNKIQRTETVWI